MALFINHAYKMITGIATHHFTLHLRYSSAHCFPGDLLIWPHFTKSTLDAKLIIFMTSKTKQIKQLKKKTSVADNIVLKV